MSTHGRFESIQLVAGADLSGAGSLYKAVVVAGTIAASNIAIGLIQNKPRSGEDLRVGYEGHMKGVAGAAIVAAARMRVTTSGYLVTCGSNELGVGRSLAAAASGATVEGLFDFRSGLTSVVSGHLI